MQMGGRRWVVGGAAMVAVVLVGLACAEQVVYRDRDFVEPPAGARGFLGFQDQARSETVCGNCHVGHQSDWEKTAHADAWGTLAANAGRRESCEGCHSVGHRGNAVSDSSSGWLGTKDARYQDVQCESCHGPGLSHVTAPDTPGNIPLAPISVGTNLSTGCGECHSGAHHPFVAEWAASGHGRIVASAAARAECQSCHTAKGALDAWGVQANYLEKSGSTGHTLAITCAVCHDPHSSEASIRSTATGAGPFRMPHSGGQLRYSIDVPNEEQNLCMKCHHKRAQPDIDPVTLTSRGPHSPEGPLLLGENVGYWFGDTPIDNRRIVGTHGTEANPRLCATCHMLRFEVTDKITNAFQFAAVGHRFQAIPCVNAQGIPTNEPTCVITARSFRGCLGSGCHGTEAAARSAFTVATTRIATLAAEVKRLVDQVRAAEVRSNDNKWTSAEGADFNYQLALFPGSQVHNPFMVEALLTGSIQEMKRRYNLEPSPRIDLRNTMSQHPTPTKSE